MILRIDAENFRSFEHLSYTVNRCGIVGIEGSWSGQPTRSNGSGKSSFLTELLTWAVFGETTEGQTASDKVRDVVRTGTPECTVTVELPFVTWTRSQKTGNKGNRLSIEGHDFHKLDDAQTWLHRLFPPKKVFSSTLVLGQGIGNRLSAWKPAERSRILSDLFGLSVFEQARVQVRKVMGQWEQARMSADTSLGTLAQQKATVSAQAHVRLDEKDATKLRRAVESNQKSRAALADELEKLNSSFTQKQGALYQATAATSSLAAEHNRLRAAIKAIEKMGVCDRCHRKMTQAAITAATKDLRPQITEIEKSLVAANAALPAAQAAFDRIVPERSALVQNIGELDQAISSMGTQLAVYDSQAQTIAMFDEQEKVARAEHEQANTELGYYILLDQAFGPSGIPLRKMESVITILNTALAHICAEVWDSEVFVQLTTEHSLKGGGTKAEIGLIVEGTNGPTYASCSPGERRRMDLTLQLALREVLLSAWKTKLPLLVCDDVVDVLDARAKVQLLENYLLPLSTNNVVFVVTPETALPSAVPRVYITRDARGSCVTVNHATNVISIAEVQGA